MKDQLAQGINLALYRQPFDTDRCVFQQIVGKRSHPIFNGLLYRATFLRWLSVSCNFTPMAFCIVQLFSDGFLYRATFLRWLFVSCNFTFMACFCEKFSLIACFRETFVNGAAGHGGECVQPS
ncbi:MULTISPECIES: hypothetical protein [unclassified Paenibacillus]|uniref:hypothetical protein n=1 Tax=unclassified Paenibacillus TaxID=185978 RepID=UPI00362D9270